MTTPGPRTYGSLCSIPLLFAVTLIAPAPASGADPLKLGAPPSVSSRPPRAVPAPDQGVPALPAPEMRTFVGPLSQPTRTGRAGVALWGAPGTASSPRGPGDPDSVGWAGAGVAVEWGAAPRGASH